MAANPNPSHITADMWWFIEELERLEGPDTVYAGSWGDFKPGYHCDAYNLWWHKDKSGVYTWRNDYSTKLPADKVLGTPLEHYGCAVDWTFLSAQAGNFANFRKYGNRIRAAWASRDPRLKGWREILCQGDADTSADGYDCVSWTERTPDATHEWHMHFSILRSYVATRSVYEAMLSILRGEQGTKGEDMIFAISDGPRKGYAGRAGGGTYEFAAKAEDLEQWRKDQGGVATVYVPEADVRRRLGIEVSALMGGGGGGTSLTEEQVRDIAEEEANEAVSGAKLVPPTD
jgi:hypothetical protein